MNLNQCTIKLINGDDRYMKEVYSSFYGYVMSICLRYTIDFQEAQEVCNDTFMKAFDNIDKYDPKKAFKNWIGKIAVNTSIDHLRKKKKSMVFVELDDQVNDIDQFQRIEIGQDQKILPLIQSLPDQYKVVFNLYVFEDYSHKEISELLGISIGTSKSNYHRAKKIITKKIYEETEFRYLLNSAI